MYVGRHKLAWSLSHPWHYTISSIDFEGRSTLDERAGIFSEGVQFYGQVIAKK